MKLRAGDGVAADDRGDRPTVVGLRHQIGSRGSLQVIRVYKIGVQALRSGLDAVEQRMRLDRVERIPTHVRDLQLGIGGRDLVDLPADPAEAIGDFVFEPALGHELHADTDAEERTAALVHPLVERIDHAVDGVETAPAIGEGADAGQYDAVGARYRVRTAGHHDRLRDAGFARRALERLGGRMQIAGAIVDNGNGHRWAPGCGNRPMTSGVADAPRCAGAAGVAVGATGACASPRTQESKNRRSTVSRSLPTMVPTLRQRRRPSVKRRNVPASIPIRSASMNPANTALPFEAPTSRNPACMAVAITI